MAPHAALERGNISDNQFILWEEEKMSVCKSSAFQLLEKMGFVRTAGSQEEYSTALMLKEEAAKTGADVTVEEFQIKDAVIRKAKLEVLEPYQKEYVVTGYKCCQNTSEEGLTAELLYAESLTDQSLVDAKGKIVLLNGYLRLPMFRKLLEAGAAGIVSFSGTLRDTDEDSDLFTRKIRASLSAFGNLPAVNMTAKDAFDMVVHKAAKVKMTVIGDEVELTSHNVIATVPGTEKGEEIISFGAHYDSTEFSTGVYDNAAGSVVIMEMLKHFAENKPRRTLKFIWFGSEEIGLEGSKNYTRAHQDELSKYRFMINVDVGGPVLGTNKSGCTGSKELTSFTDMFMKAKGYWVEVRQGIYSSDSIPFADNGIPAVNFSRDGEQGTSYIHCRHDIVDYLSEDAIGSMLDVVLDYSDFMVNAVVFPEKREMPQDMKEEVDKYLFKKELETAPKQ